MTKSSEFQGSQGAAACLTFPERPTTPHAIRKYRKSFFSEPGQRTAPFGAIDDQIEMKERLKDVRFGQSQAGQSSASNGGSVAEIFAPKMNDAISLFIQNRKERIYRTHQREPLGKPYVRGSADSMAGKALAGDDTFAKSKQNALGSSAKALIFFDSMKLEGDADKVEKTSEQYKKSHNSYAAGEQKSRKYDWKGLNPSTHRFGVVDDSSANILKQGGVAACLGAFDTQQEGNKICNIRAQRFQENKTTNLGRSKKEDLAAMEELQQRRWKQQAILKEHNKEWSVKQVIEGEYSEADQLPDPDLGRATRPGFRNSDTSQVFGAPTVRTDVPPPQFRSIADNQNYGDDTSCNKLLYPNRFNEMGVNDEDFVRPRPKHELANLFSKIGEDLTDADFDRIYDQACQSEGATPLGQASVEELRDIYLDHLVFRS